MRSVLGGRADKYARRISRGSLEAVMFKALRHKLVLQQPFSLLRWFSVLSLLCIGAACIVSSYLVSSFLTQHMLRRDGTVMLEFVQSVADLENHKSRTEGREPNIREKGMQELFDQLSGVSDVLRANIYAPDQTLIWSSDRILIGKRFDGNDELDKALQGELKVETGFTGKDEHPKNEHIFLSDRAVQFVETYLPIRDSLTRRVIGVAEIYRVPSDLFHTIARGKQMIWFTGVLSALFLYLTLFWAVRRADATIRSQQTRLIESETLAAVGEMGSAVAHGIRNPLASIRSSAELCIDDNAAPQVRDSATDIIAQVDRLEKWVRDLLNYAQPETHPVGRVALGSVINTVCEQFSRDFARQGIVPTLSIQGRLPRVVGDEAAIEQVFTSIVANAMEAMPGGGQLLITTAVPSHRGAPVVVTVSDTGVGISDKQKEKLFTAFQTTKPKGMGLGLALVRRILRRAGGEVRVESAVGVGTQVILSFATRGSA